jgi:pantothenate kinase
MYFPKSILVTDQEISTADFTESFIETCHALVEDLYALKDKDRFVLGVAGPSGSGKSVLARIMQDIAKHDHMVPDIAIVTIDAYHFPNGYLRDTKDEDGKFLIDSKGRYDTYDVGTLEKDLISFKEGNSISFPAYSRVDHEPKTSNEIISGPAILILEGLWLFYDTHGWQKIAEHLDASWYVDASDEKLSKNTIGRHVRGGRALKDAEDFYTASDMKNNFLVRTTKSRAQRNY